MRDARIEVRDARVEVRDARIEVRDARVEVRGSRCASTSPLVAINDDLVGRALVRQILYLLWT
ncbi:hypothetical protein A3733_02135 [Pseudoalteromonas shioyasakiensis]|nr:hypothetical protein A3733_02135 [Pseudoalteromonas shioyasakiensis]